MIRSKRQANTDFEATLDRHQDEMRSHHITESITQSWNGMDSFDGIAPHKTRVTIRLDADMVRWFRKLGPNYSQRMNDVLRIYWTALLAGHVSAYIRDDPMPRLALGISDMRDRLAARQADDGF